MEKTLMCPRAEICYIYKIYVDNTKDDNLGIIQVSAIERKDFYTCKALSAVEKGQLSEETARRLQGLSGCLIIDQANKLTERRRPDS